MNAIVCEMCSSHDIIKVDGVYVCQSCGTKYSVEEAKKLVFEGNITVDNSKHLSELYESARAALNSGNDNVAKKIYDSILIEDPLNWEPIFYTTYYQAKNCRICDITSEADSVKRCIPSVITKIHDDISNSEEQKKAVIKIVLSIVSLCTSMCEAAVQSQNRSTDTSLSGYADDLNTCTTRIIAASKMTFVLGTSIASCWPDDIGYHQPIAVSYEAGINGLNRVASSNNDDVKTLLQEFVPLAMKYDPSYQNTPAFNKAASATTNGGCYIATCVYGSYDCPQVWTLRRFRDYSLASTWYGRLFISIYYAISPTLVKWFGRMPWFTEPWRKYLDKKVSSLNQKGFENTPYFDRQF